METQKIIDVVQKVTGKDIIKESRNRDVVEARALYYKACKTIYPNITLEKMGEPLNKKHCTVRHIYIQYDVFEKYNPIMKTQLKTILDILDYKSKKRVIEEQQSEEVKNLNIKVHILRKQKDELLLKLQAQKEVIEEFKTNKYKYSILSKITDLLLTATEEQQEVILEKLEAFYNINSKLNLYKKEYNQY